jgi:hypothetical protein
MHVLDVDWREVHSAIKGRRAGIDCCQGIYVRHNAIRLGINRRANRMSVRKRTWKTSKGVEKEAWVVDYVDRVEGGKRRLRSFDKKRMH